MSSLHTVDCWKCMNVTTSALAEAVSSSTLAFSLKVFHKTRNVWVELYAINCPRRAKSDPSLSVPVSELKQNVVAFSPSSSPSSLREWRTSGQNRDKLTSYIARQLKQIQCYQAEVEILCCFRGFSIHPWIISVIFCRKCYGFIAAF